jgi:four helix bundle protein
MFPYEQLEVYKKAYLANQKTYRLLRGNNIIAPYAKNQLGRASLGIILNIAEGSAKYSVKDRRNFFITARGSVFECSSIVCFLHGEGEIPDDLKNDLYSSFDEISRILYVMIKNLEGQ